ncbi:unnamed protein product [Prorocentrum cordatum]|uniref:Hexosyltransferase n=1 Tax=Prorocentrum cordatum TaxID=2364126 RepID=A0ABN9X658_9DINO|nr:unnamed protein product [Polarella glacialis]
MTRRRRLATAMYWLLEPEVTSGRLSWARAAAVGAAVLALPPAAALLWRRPPPGPPLRHRQRQGGGASRHLEQPAEGAAQPHESMLEAAAEEISESRDWEVVDEGGAEVWSDRDAASSKVRRTLPKCTVFSGRRDSPAGADGLVDWVRLLDGSGYVKVAVPRSSAFEDTTLVEETEAHYEEVQHGSCEENGMWPILSSELCEAAAEALGLGSRADLVLSTASEPGCFYMHGQSSAPAASPSGVAQRLLALLRGGAWRGQLCSSARTCHPVTTLTVTSSTSTSSTGFSSTETSSTGTSTQVTLMSAAPTSTTPLSVTSTSGNRSVRHLTLFCWSVATPGGYEIELVATQYRRGASIFNCDDFAVLSASEGVEIGPVDVIMILDTDGGGEKGVLDNGRVTTNSFLNTEVFIQAWGIVMEQTRATTMDWIVKADPDTVFFPERLRQRVAEDMASGGEPVFYMNCNKVFGPGDEPSKLFGSLEVFSQSAVRTFQNQKHRCLEELDWHGWGEDYFMSHCMDHIGVARVEDFDSFSDNRCNSAPCNDATKLSFHDFKDEGSWFWCWETSLGEGAVAAYARRAAQRDSGERAKTRTDSAEEKGESNEKEETRLA